jgi:hypothetical protein
MATRIIRLTRARHPPATDHHTGHPEFRGVQFVTRGLVINVPNNLATQTYPVIHKEN